MYKIFSKFTNRAKPDYYKRKPLRVSNSQSHGDLHFRLDF